MFQCHSPKSSHPRPLPQSPKDCSIHLCFFCYLTYRIIVDIVYQLDIKTVQFSRSVMSDFLDQLGCSTPGFPVHHQHLELAQTHAHQVGDTIQPFHPLLSPSPPIFNLSQHQGFFPVSQLFSSGGQSIGVAALASVFPKNTQD